jgi:S-adenosylmethionine:tRNA ribosyltransferase-isomerase
MKLSNFNYNLPPELIAQEPMKPRDHSRLLVLDKTSGKIAHRHFFDILEYLKVGDVLVVNNTKVFACRLIGQKKLTGGKMEIFLLHKNKNNSWQCLIKGSVKRENLIVEFKNKLLAQVLKNNNDGTWEVKFNKTGTVFMKIIEKIGLVPLPPYIKRETAEKSDKTNYQTVFADDKQSGSVAAPTAGLHFTSELMKKIKALGVEVLEVTLHVGLGTFLPIKTENILEHKMHSEFISVKHSVIKKLMTAKKEKRRIIAVGTTSCRTLESLATHDLSKIKKDFSGHTNIFIYPGYQFKMVDALITNFHLPKSSLLLLVSALAGKSNIDKSYKVAIKKQYRFFSYGDAMFIK